jgi:hypothetical protein
MCASLFSVHSAKGLFEILAAAMLDNEDSEKVRRFGVENEHLLETSIQGPRVSLLLLHLGYSSFWR